MGTDERVAAELLQRIQHRWSSHPEEVLAAASAGWPAMAARATQPEDAETCRQAMLAASRVGRRPEASAWKVRAAIRFAALGWPEGVAATLVTEFYVALAHANDFFASGTHLAVLRPSAEAQAVLDEMRTVGEQGRQPYLFGPDGALLMRLAVEKTALLLLLAGDLDRARAEFELALGHARDDWRGALKVRASVALIDFLLAVGAGVGNEEAAEDTVRLAGSPEAARAVDIGRLLAENAERMLTGRQDLMVYENL